VVTIDGPGTPYRSKAFHDASYGRLGDAGGLADHINALKELAADRPYMDLTRVGMFGHSAGGFMTAQALLTYPDFYKVGLASSGDYDSRFYGAYWGEKYEGLGANYNHDLSYDTYYLHRLFRYFVENLVESERSNLTAPPLILA
jgi:dipeptidyl aminopeptidase/acylaminoacyl peptidase